MRGYLFSWGFPVTAVALTVFLAGCGESSSQPQTDPQGPAVENVQATAADGAPGHNYKDWWCTEHGVPEKDCSICNAQAARRFKEKGDWCEEHGRAESQCFLCDPSRAEKFAKLFEAKFGHAPPKPTE